MTSIARLSASPSLVFSPPERASGGDSVAGTHGPRTTLGPRLGASHAVGSVAGVSPERVARDSDPMTHIAELASDRYRGRASPSEGLNAAAKYIASVAARYGLTGANPDNPKSPYLQPFTIRTRAPRHDTSRRDLDAKARTLFSGGAFEDHAMSDADVRQALGPARYAQATRDGHDPRAMLNTELQDRSTVNNVVARLEGTGPNKDEHIVILAHYDHIGRNGDDIYNGADDNASGTSAVLAMIPELVKMRDAGQLDRSVVFLWTAAEEKGLLGAEHFARNPVPGVELDPERLFALNLDMVGRLDPDQLSVLDIDSRRRRNVLSPLVDQTNEALGTPFPKLRRDIQRLVNRQDGAAFSRRGVPTLMLFEGMTRFGWLNPDYHQPTDTVQRMLADNGGEKVRKVVPFANELVRRMASFSADESEIEAPPAPQMPPSFSVDGRKVTFVDLESVESKVTIDARTRRATVRSKVVFDQPERGAPVIDLVPDIQGGTINGEPLSPGDYPTVRDPDNQSSMRIVAKDLPEGRHELELEYDLDQVRFSGGRVGIFQQFSDLSPRRFAEQFFPSNFEFDQYRNTVELELKGTDVEHDVIANGHVLRDGNRFRIDYPSNYNATSFFLDLAPRDTYVRAEGSYRGLEGEIPILAYGANRNQVRRALEAAKRNLREHERDFGPYPHPWLILKIEGSGGMEYSGATRTSLSALKHEQHHNYFARSMMPASGNAGWFDEAAASWHDAGYPERRRAPLFPRKLSGFSPWRRETARPAYSHGADFLAHLSYLFRDRGGLKPLLRELFEKYQWQPVTTEMLAAFLKNRSEGLEVDIDALFDRHVYGRRGGIAQNDDVEGGQSVKKEQDSASRLTNGSVSC